jgi:hypothetical protein
LKTVILAADEADKDAENEAHSRASAGPQAPRGANQQAVVSALRKARGEPLGLMRLMAVMRVNNSSPVLQALGPLVAKGIVRELGEEGAKRWELI